MRSKTTCRYEGSDTVAESIAVQDTQLGRIARAQNPLSLVAEFRKNIPLWEVAVISLTACLSLGLMQFVGLEKGYLQYLHRSVLTFDAYRVIKIKAWWVASSFVSCFLLPAMVMTLVLGNRLGDCNLSYSGFRRHIRIYLGLFASILPIVWIASLTPAFNTYYPMYEQAGRSLADLLIWESLYAAQFFALEFFFRGFLIGGLSKHIGALSVPVCTIPYMMLHFLKPWPEAVGSVVAGLILGGLAWKTKSIWGGVYLHTAVAFTMDLMALDRTGRLPPLHR